MIKPLDGTTRGQYMDLCQYCFGMPDSARDRYVTEDYELANSLGAFDGDRLAAGMWYFAFDMRVRGEFIPMAGVAAVATWPEYRNRGLVRELLARAQEKMRAEGRPLSVLAPFKYSFYYDLGWAPTFDVSVITFEPHQIRAFGDEGYTVRQISNPDEWETFEALNSQFGERYNGPVCRDRLYWMRRYFAWDTPERRQAYLVEKGGEARGFFVTRLTPLHDDPEKRELRILQSVWLDPAVQRAIFAFFRSHRDQVKRVTMFLPPDVRWVHLFSDPMIEYKIKAKMMTKLVDAPAALQRLTYDAALVGRVTLDVSAESTAPWNGGTFAVSFREGKATVANGEAGAAAVKLSVQNVAELYMGYRSVSDLREAREISGPDADLELLSRAFPRTPTYIDDWF